MVKGHRAGLAELSVLVGGSMPAMPAKALDRVRRGTPLDPAKVAIVRALVAKHGLVGASEVLGLARNLVAYAAAGADILRGSHLAFDQALANLPEAER